jgi:hypothetical protein
MGITSTVTVAFHVILSLEILKSKTKYAYYHSDS